MNLAWPCRSPSPGIIQTRWLLPQLCSPIINYYNYDSVSSEDQGRGDMIIIWFDNWSDLMLVVINGSTDYPNDNDLDKTTILSWD